MSSHDHDLYPSVSNSVPVALYPPAPEGSAIRSSLSSTPLYGNSNARRFAAPMRMTAAETKSSNNILPPQQQQQQQQQQKQSQVPPSSVSQPRVAIRASPFMQSDHQYQLVAAINLHPDEDLAHRAKYGAHLCEVSQVSFHSTVESRLAGRMWQIQSKVTSRLSPQLGPSITATCLSWLPTSTSSSPLRVATGLSTGNLCIHTFPSEESITTQSHYQQATTQEQFSSGRNKRLATAVAWRPSITNQVALGLSMGSSAGPAGGLGGGGVARNKPRAADFGCLVWDVTQSTSTPLLKVCHNSAVTSLEWLHGGQLLAVGCQMKPLMLYDFRVSSSSPLTVWDAESVQGMRANDNALATISKSTSSNSSDTDSILLWDLRRLDAPLAEIKFDHEELTTLEWSRPGVLSIAIQNRVLHYDVASSKPSLLGQTYAPLPILDMTMIDNRERFLVVLQDKSVLDVPKHTTSPIAFSKRDGQIVHAFENHVWNYTRNTMDDVNHDDPDISVIMKARAGGWDESLRYSMDALTNLKILEPSNGNHPVHDKSHDHSLIELWRWIARLESQPQHSSLFSNMTLMSGGVWRLLEMDSSSPQPLVDDDTATIAVEAECLDLVFYDSDSRRKALVACGWASNTGNSFQIKSSVLQECHKRCEYERAAALAVWHDNFSAAVQALDTGATETVSDHASLLQVVSICIAGYSRKTSDVWENACSRLLKRPDLQQDHNHPSGVAYLDALLRFLLAKSHGDRLSVILDDTRLRLCDRVGFACRFLRRNELRAQLHKWIAQYQEEGNLDGLLFTGLTMEGIKILQSYVDKTGDVQTASLVTSRVIMPPSWRIERRICSEWLDSYRGLLNIWQMWQSRALFDVDRAELLRSLGQNTKGETRIAKQVDPDYLLASSNPGQLEARCNYCSVSLSGARKQDGLTNQWLARSKNVLSSCPRCRKPLPRCSICLLSLGCLNPYMELMNRGSTNDASSSATSLPFAEWFTWCMRCKHGGHAHHLVGWFANHDTCPVSGCDCQCQFDMVEKIRQASNDTNNALVNGRHLNQNPERPVG